MKPEPLYSRVPKSTFGKLLQVNSPMSTNRFVTSTDLEPYFQNFRNEIIGIDLTNIAGSGSATITYADWTASGRLYRPIENILSNQIGPYVANTHTESTLTGTTMTRLYHEAQTIIKEHVSASHDDVLICCGSGMTGAVNKFQRILGLRLPEKLCPSAKKGPQEKPVVFVTHMEHHSNQTSWCECDVVVEVVRRNSNGLPDLDHLEEMLEHHAVRPLKIGAFTACSNVTGIQTPYHEMARTMHKHGGLCFVDFAASAPYVDIRMHTENPSERLDAIFFSPHKFLGGPGSCGILLFNKALYTNEVPDEPGGGTVTWTNPWGKHRFYESVELREDGGTPGFLQAIRAALAIQLKEAMGTAAIAQREKELVKILLNGIKSIPGITVLEGDVTDRLCIVSFFSSTVHHNLFVRLLNDRFGIQSRGGCSCAGTLGHILLGVDYSLSEKITSEIDSGNLASKPGWVRVSLHPTSTRSEAHYLVASIAAVQTNYQQWSKDYSFDAAKGDFVPITEQNLPLGFSHFESILTNPSGAITKSKSFWDRIRRLFG